MIFLENKTETIIFEEIERYLEKNEWDSLSLQLAAFFVSLLVIFLNGSMVKFILKQKRKTFLDWIIMIDLCLCLGYIIVLAMLASNACYNEVVCLIKIGLGFFISILNRMLTVLVVVYRTIYVLKPHIVNTLTKRNNFGNILLGSSICLSVGATIGMVIFREKYISFKGIISQEWPCFRKYILWTFSDFIT